MLYVDRCIEKNHENELEKAAKLFEDLTEKIKKINEKEDVR